MRQQHHGTPDRSRAGKWEAFRRRDASELSRSYDERAIGIGYAGDGSVGARRKPELLCGLEDLDIQELSLGGFDVLPVGGDSAVVARHRVICDGNERVAPRRIGMENDVFPGHCGTCGVR